MKQSKPNGFGMWDSFFSFSFFGQYLSLNSGLYTCEAGAVLPEPSLQHFFAVVILEVDSCF
jgi:hypothetical protein